MRKIKIVTFPLLILFLIALEIFSGFVLRIQEAEAAHTIDTSYQGARANSAPYTFNYTCGSGTTIFVLSIVVGGTTARAGGAPTYNGVALTQADQNRQSTETFAELWYLLNPPTGSSYQVSIPNTGAVYLSPVASSYIAATGNTAFRTANGNSGTSTNPTGPTLTSLAVGDVIVAVVGSGATTWDPTGRTGTQLYDRDDGQYGNGAQYLIKTDTNDTAMAWTFGTSDDWAIVEAAFKEEAPTITVAPSVPQPPNVATPSTLNVMGVFSIVRNNGTGSATAVTIKENGGSIDATNELENVELWLSSDKTWDAGDTQLDTAKNFTGGVDGTCTFNESFDVTATTKYLIVRLDVKSGVTLDKTIEIQIQDITTTDEKSGLPCDLSGTTTVTASWWNGSWSYRKKLTFNNSAQSENLTNFPVLVKLSTSNFTYADAKSDGTDLRFIDSDNTTELKYHIEKWNPSGDSFIWVKVPQIDASSNTDYIYMYYGNADAGDVQDEPNTFSNNYIAVWHTDEASWSGTTGEVKDSTVNGNDGTRAGNATTTTSGQVNGCGTFDGNGDYVEVPDSASLDVTDLTINAWANSSDFTPSDYLRNYNRMIVSKTDSKVGYQLGLTDENKPYFGFEDLSVNQMSKKNNAIPTQSDTTGTDGRMPRAATMTRGDYDNLYTGGGSVIKDGSTYKMWYSGYNNDAPAKICIYYATSTDGGLTWTKYDNTKPTAAQDSGQNSTNGRISYGSAGKGDTTYAIFASVIKDGSTYKMWYTGYSDESTPKYRIFHATSSDGLTWTKYNNSIPADSDTTGTDGRIPIGSAGKGDSTWTVFPSVIKDGSTYKMWYTGYDGTNCRIFYATSSDGLTWTKYNNSIAASTQDTGQTSTDGRIYLGSDTTGDDSFVYYCSVIKDGSTYKMWYSGYDGSNIRVYYATSPDGLTWTKYDNSIPTNSDTTSTNGRIPRGTTTTLGDGAHAGYPSAVKDGSTYKIWYTGRDGTGSPYYVIYLATLETGVTSNTAVPSEFRMVTGVADTTADTIKLYVNGALDTSGTTSVNGVNNSEKLTMGNLLNGKIDEVRISTVTRSADWIAAQYLSMTCQFTSFPPPTVTLGDGTDPGSSTVAPGSTNNYLDQFTFVIDTSTDSVTALTVTSANTSAIASMQIWNDAITTQYFSTVSSPVGDNWNFSGGTAIPVSTTTASFRVIFTAKDHSLAEGTYAVTGTVTSYTCTNAKSGTDTDSATITVDNSPPADATWGTITPGDMQIELNWTNPGADFYRELILRKQSSEVTDSPTEGTEYNVNDTIGESTVRYVDSGTNSTDTGLTNGTSYYYKIFAYDTYINYAVGVSTGPHIPIAEGGPIITTGSGYWHSTTPNQPWPAGIVPDPGDTVIIDTGHVVTSTAPVTISSITANGSLYLDAGVQAVTFTINNGGKLINSGTVRVSSAIYNVTLQAEAGGGITFEGNDIDYNGKKIYLARLDYKPAMSLGSGETVELSGSCTFYALTTQSGSSFIQGTNNDIYISSNTTLASGTFTKDSGSGKLYFIGDLELASANQNLGNVYIGSSPETTTLTEDFSADSLTINSRDVFNTKGYEVTVTTDIVINGTLDCTDSAPNNEGDGTIIILGRDWTKADTSTFTVAGATVTFSNASSTSTLTGSTTFYGLVSTASGKRIEFSSSTVTYVTGHLNLEDVILRSTLDGATWYLTLSGTQDVSGVDVQDSNAGGGSAINAINSIDSGNNTNWNFATHRYWVGGGSSTNWNAVGPTNWGTASGVQDNASVPGADDNVFFDANSGAGTANISASITVLSIDCTGFTGTWTQANSTTLTVAGGLKLVSGMTYAPSADSQAITITATGNVYTGGKSLGTFTVNGSGITVTLQDSFTLRATTTYLTLTQGTLDTNGQTLNIGRFSSSNSNTRTLTLGASQITCTGASTTVWNMSTATNLTFNANTSTIICSGTDATFAGGGKNFNIVQLTGSGWVTIANANTFATLARTGTAAKTDRLDIWTDQTITGTLNLNGNSQINRLWVTAGTFGNPCTITVNTGGTIFASNVDFRDIHMAYADQDPWDASAVTGKSGDCGGNSGITFTTAKDCYWVGNGGNWSDDDNHWATSSGGSAGDGNLPLPQDDVIFDTNSFSSASQTCTADMPRLGKSIDWGSVDSSPTWALSTETKIYGSLTLASGMTFTQTQELGFQGRGAFTLTSNGQSFSNSVAVDMFGGTLTLQDAFSMNSGMYFYIGNGTFNANNFDVSVGHLSSNNSNTRTITMGSGTWTLSGTGTVWDISTTTNLTLNPGNSTISITGTSATAKTFAGGGKTFNNLSVTGGGAGAVIFTGANTFNNFTINNPKTVTLPASVTTTINGTFKAIGNAANPITLQSSSGTQATLDLDGSAYVTNVAATNINGTGTAVTDYKGSVSNCNNWTVSATEVWVGQGADNNWATTDNWASQVPTSSVDAMFNDNYSNSTCTIAAAASVRSIDFTGYTSTLTHNSDITLSIGDASGGSLTMDSGMTYTLGSSTTSAIVFVSTTTGNNITTGGKTLGDVTFNGVGGEWILEDGLFLNNLTITAGTLDTKSGENNSINVAGNWNYAGGTFECRQSTVTFDNASSTSTLTGSTTFYGLVSTASGKRIEFSSSTVTYVTGHLNLEDVILRSTLDGATWYLTLSGTQDVSGVDVQDSNASGGSMIYALNCTDSGNNINWHFAHIVKTGCSYDSTAYNFQRKLVRSSNGDLHTVYYRYDGSHYQIYYAKSTDGGESWTETQLTSESYHQYYPSIAIDSNNYIHVVWFGAHSGSTIYLQIRYIKYTTSWQSIENLTSGNYHQSRPSIAIDSNNYLHIVWQGRHSGSTTYDQIRYIKYTTSWQSIENLTSGNYHQWFSSIAIDSNNYLHVVWQGRHSGSTTYWQIRYIKYTTSWQSIENLTSESYDQYYPSIAIDSNNYIHVVWFGAHSGSTTYSQIRYIKYTTSWQSIENLTSESYNQSNPSIAIDSNNYLHVVWNGYHSGSPTYTQIRYIKYTTSWQSIENLTSASADQPYPNLIWSLRPMVNGVKINRPKNGYAFVWCDDMTVKYYASDDLEWDSIESPLVAPAAITDLTGLCDSDTGEVTLSWSTPGDDGWNNTLPEGSKYRIDYSSYSIQWSTTTYDVEIPTHSVTPYTQVSHTITGLTGETTWYFQIWTADEIPNWSDLSNGATVWVTAPPSAVTDLTATSGTGQGEIELSWTAPGDDGDTGPISGGQYHIKYSSDSTHSWDDMPYEVQWTTSTSPGNSETKTITGLSMGTTYYFYIETADEVPNWSELSNKATGYVLTDLWKSVQEGVWSSTSTWDQGIAPLSWGRVEIYDTVTYDQNSTDVSCSSITVKNAGILEFEQAVATNTLIVQGNILIELGGKFLMEPNTGFASIVKIKCSSDGDYGIVVQDGGIFDVRGSSMTYWKTALAQQANSGQNQMVTNDDTGWNVGDKVTVGPSISTSTVYESKITAISGTTITLQDNFTVNRSTGSEVVNLTRNCVITSTGTGKSYIQNLSTIEANFNMEWVEASYLGSGSTGKYGITFDGSGTRGKINYSSIHNGYCGIYLNSSSNNTLTNNSCYSNNSDGIYFYFSSNNTLTNNSCYSNFYGIYLSVSSNNTLTNNSCYSNSWNGICLDSSSNNTLTYNGCYSNSDGIWLGSSSNNTLTNNSCYSNSDNGIWLETASQNNTLTNNSCYLNSSGIRLDAISNNTLTNNSSYSNAYGIYTRQSTNNSVIDCQLGKDGNNTSGDLGYFGGFVSTLILKDCELYSSPTKVNTAGINTAGSYLLSYNQDDSTGTVRIWGDYKINSGTKRYSYAYQLYSSTATAPKTMKGSSSASDVKTSDSICKTELITITYDGSEWDIVGSVSGALGSFTGNQNDWSSSGGEFTLDFTQSSPQTGDKVDFVTVAASNDADLQKDVQFGPCASALNSGKSRLKVDTGGTLELVGTETYPTLVDRISGTTYYTLISTGSSGFTAGWFKFQNVDKDGVQFHSSCSVTLSSGTFDYAQSASTRTYITCNSLTSNATFYNLTFDDIGSVTPYNIYVTGNDTNLSWYIASYGGVRGGEDYDYDPNNKIIWADQTPPAAITDLTGQCDGDIGDVTLYWSTPGDDGWNNTLVEGSKYRIDYSSYSIQWSTTTYDVEIPTHSVAPHTQVSYTVTGLTGETTWYFQIWTADEVPNWSGLSNGATVWVNSVLSVSISTNTINLGVVEPGSYALTVSSVVITNNGNIKQKFKLLIVSEPNGAWESVTATVPGAEQYRYSGIFRSTQPVTSDFLPEDSFSVSTERTSSSADLARDADPDEQKGFNVSPDNTRNLWFKFEAPTSTDITTTQAIPVRIIAIPYP